MHSLRSLVALLSLLGLSLTFAVFNLAQAAPDTSLPVAAGVVRAPQESGDDEAQSPWKPGKRLNRGPYMSLVPGKLPCDGRDYLYRGHVDATYATYDKDGQLVVKIVDGSDVRDLTDVCIRLPKDGATSANGSINVGDEISRLIVPEGKNWRFLGNSGAMVWIAPQTDLDGGPVWAGLGAFDPEHEYKVPQNVDFNQVNLQLNRVIAPDGSEIKPGQNSGDAQVNVFNVGFNGPNANLISTNLGIWNYKAGVGSHAHTNWAFSQPGYWKLYWSAELSVGGEKKKSAEFEQIWAVGSNKELMLQGANMPDTGQILRTAEQLRAERGMTAPAENGFDYHGDNAGEAADSEYDPGQCDDLQEPTAIQGADRPALQDAEGLKGYMDNDWWKSSDKKEFNAQHYDLTVWNDRDDKEELSRLRIFTDRTSTEEKAELMKPLDKPSEANDWWVTEPNSDTAPRGGDSNVITVSDDELRSYTPRTFARGGSIASRISKDTLYSFDSRSEQSPTFTVSLPADPSGKIQHANIYIETSEPQGLNDASHIALGDLSTEENKDNWQTVASGTDSDRMQFIVKPGETKPLSVLFTSPGLAKLTINAQIIYKDGQVKNHPGPVSSGFNILVGNEAINTFREFMENNDERLPLVEKAQLSEGAKEQNQANQAAYEAKQHECQTATTPEPETPESETPENPV